MIGLYLPPAPSSLASQRQGPVSESETGMPQAVVLVQDDSQPLSPTEIEELQEQVEPAKSKPKQTPQETKETAEPNTEHWRCKERRKRRGAQPGFDSEEDEKTADASAKGVFKDNRRLSENEKYMDHYSEERAAELMKASNSLRKMLCLRRRR